MSDLFCAATVLLACPGQAEYVGGCFRDEGGTLTGPGRQQARALAERLAGRRVARVWTSDASRAVQTAEIVAHQLGIGVQTRPSLRDGDETGGETGGDVIARITGQLRDIADEHRGETVLVIVHPRSGRAALGALVGRARADALGSEAPVEVMLDADGVRLVP